MSFYISKYEASKITRLSPYTLKHYRQCGKLIEDVHYIRLNPTHVKYNKHYLIEWVRKYKYNTQAQMEDIENDDANGCNCN